MTAFIENGDNLSKLNKIRKINLSLNKARDSGYETPLNSPNCERQPNEESTSEESIELNKNDVFLDEDDCNDEVRT